MESDSQSLFVFDGANDFLVWRARVEGELLRRKLLGFALVWGYDGTQSFTYKGQVVPPKCDDRLGSWGVLMESDDAMGIVRRYLKPGVESAIVEMNMYDCWASLNAIYGSGRDPATRSISEMYRVLQHMFFGDKTGEYMSEFVARWGMVVRQYMTITGVQLTDPARSAMLEYAMPRSWRTDMKQWTGSRLFIPFAELVERVVAKADHTGPDIAKVRGEMPEKSEKHSTDVTDSAIDATGNPRLTT